MLSAIKPSDRYSLLMIYNSMKIDKRQTNVLLNNYLKSYIDQKTVKNICSSQPTNYLYPTNITLYSSNLNTPKKPLKNVDLKKGQVFYKGRMCILKRCFFQ
ncbi:Hypothetical protein SRAE_2000456400 [Strongyloides ratti]|uniref:Uncharacterized protein n=1 Tax=Strongyloides ratti TaxID=34506 RepID=A0A090LJM5_STRRB|nr:Hypothetical protein SRAE_2000456400 [Strongyloides ratti]CEF69918.1 Hypothetical protein SRAE_2000456400 [Strongyloides ratti]